MEGIVPYKEAWATSRHPDINIIYISRHFVSTGFVIMGKERCSAVYIAAAKYNYRPSPYNVVFVTFYSVSEIYIECEQHLIGSYSHHETWLDNLRDFKENI